MKMNRRNVLIGLGTAVVGGGAAFGSGAFSQVEADRDVSVNVASDSNANLQITTTSSSGDAVDTSGEALKIDLSSSLYDGDGINTDATVRVGSQGIGEDLTQVSDGAFKVANGTYNSGSGGVDYDITLEADAGDLNSMTIYYYDDVNASAGSFTDNGSAGNFSSSTSPIATIGDNNSIGIAVEVDTTDVSSISNQPQIRIQASTV